METLTATTRRSSRLGSETGRPVNGSIAWAGVGVALGADDGVGSDAGEVAEADSWVADGVKVAEDATEVWTLVAVTVGNGTPSQPCTPRSRTAASEAIPLAAR